MNEKNETDQNNLEESQTEATSNEFISQELENDEIHTEPTQKEPSRFAKFVDRNFGAESKFGRSMRSLIRWALIVLGIFAAGMLVSYILFGLPLKNDLKAATTQLVSLTDDLEKTTNTLTATNADLEAEQNLRKQAMLDADMSNARAAVLSTSVSVHAAQIAILEQDGPVLKQALDDAEKEFESLKLYLESQDPNLTDTISSRLALIKKEYVSDPATAYSDLEILLDRLAEAEEFFLMK